MPDPPPPPPADDDSPGEPGPAPPRSWDAPATDQIWPNGDQWARPRTPPPPAPSPTAPDTPGARASRGGTGPEPWAPPPSRAADPEPWAPPPASAPPGSGEPAAPAAPWGPPSAPAPPGHPATPLGGGTDPPPWAPPPSRAADPEPWAPPPRTSDAAEPPPGASPLAAPGADDEWLRPIPDPRAGRGPGPPPAEPWTPAGYADVPVGERPQRSPAYAAPASAAYAPGPAPTPETPVGVGPDAAPGRGAAPPLVAPPRQAGGDRRRRVALGLAALVVVALAVGAFVVFGGGDDGGVYTFGTVARATESVTVTTRTGAEPRALEEGETVLAGWVVATTGDSAVTLELAGGGVVRFDKGATLTFADEAADPETGRTKGRSRPAIQIQGGRTWVNPAGDAASSAIALAAGNGDVTTSGNPVAIDCTAACQVEAPAGGVTLTTDGGRTAAPGPNEAVTLAPGDSVELTTAEGPSEWAQQNLDADAKAGLPEPEADDGSGVRAGAVANGTYRLSLDVTGPPSGDAIPEDLEYAQGASYTVNLVVDGSACVTVPCDVTVTADEGATGTARVENGVVMLSFTQPINCFDETMTTVVVPGIGVTTVQASLEVLDAQPMGEGETWVANAFQGTGTLAATLTTPCNAGETLGTATSTIAVSGTLAV